MCSLLSAGQSLHEIIIKTVLPFTVIFQLTCNIFWQKSEQCRSRSFYLDVHSDLDHFDILINPNSKVFRVECVIVPLY